MTAQKTLSPVFSDKNAENTTFSSHLFFKKEHAAYLELSCVTSELLLGSGS